MFYCSTYCPKISIKDSQGFGFPTILDGDRIAQNTPATQQKCHSMFFTSLVLYVYYRSQFLTFYLTCQNNHFYKLVSTRLHSILAYPKKQMIQVYLKYFLLKMENKIKYNAFCYKSLTLDSGQLFFNTNLQHNNNGGLL